MKFNSAPTVEKQLNPSASPLQPVANSFLQAHARGREWQEKEALSLEPVTKRNFREMSACHGSLYINYNSPETLILHLYITIQ